MGTDSMDYRQPVVIYAAPPPATEQFIHAQPAAYRPMFPRDGRLQATYQPRRERGRSPGSRGSVSDGDRSPSPGHRSDGSDSDGSVGRNSKKTTVLVKNLSGRTNDSSLEEALYHEFKKYGEILNINIKPNGTDKYACVQFTKPEEAELATHSTGKVFLGQEIKVSLKGSKKRPELGDELDFDPHATRTVFVGNLEKTMMHGELRNIFERYGDVVDVDIKKMQTGITTYAFVQYIDLHGAMLAKKKMDRECIGHNRIKVGYGRGTPTNSLWVGNLPPSVQDHELSKAFHPFGYVQRCLLDTHYWQALLRFETIEACTRAFADMHGKMFLGRRLAVDYASPACRDGFYSRMEKNGLLDRRRLDPSPTPPDAHVNYQNVARTIRNYAATQQARPAFGTPPAYIPPRDTIPREFNDYREKYGDRPRSGMEFETRDFFGRDKYMRERVPSPMSRHSRESISPASSANFYKNQIEKEKKKKRKRSVSGSPDQITKRKEKKKKKDKKKMKLAQVPGELGYNTKEGEDFERTKSKAELKKERKERKKAEKAKKKAERKEKKLDKLRDMEEKLKLIQNAVAAEGFDDSRVTNNDTIPAEKEPTTEMNIASQPDISEISDNSQLDSLQIQEHQLKEIDEFLDESGVKREELPRNENNTSAEVKTEKVNGENDTPQSPEKIKPVDDEKKKRFDRRRPSNSSDSSSSSSSSSESDDSDDSSDDDRDLKHRSYKPSRQSNSREPKAYRKDIRDAPVKPRDDSRERYEREYRARYDESRRSPRSYSRSRSQEDRHSNHGPSPRKRSRSRSPYSRDSTRPYDRTDPRRERSSPPPPPPPGKDSLNPTAPISNHQPNYKLHNSNNGQNADTLMDLLRRFPVMWQGLLGLKNDTAAVQMHFLSGNANLGENSLPRAAQPNEVPPPLRISQRMKLEQSQLEGVDKRIAQPNEHCMLLALPCGRDPLDVHAQTRALKTGFITYLQQKQAAGIINVPNPSSKQPAYVVHIFPPCDFAQDHLARVAPDLLDSAADSGHLMVLVTPV